MAEEWTGYDGGAVQNWHRSASHIRVASGVTVIPEGAFEDCRDLRVVDLSNVTTISRFAFSNCHKLEHIIWPATAVEIKQEAFTFCKRLGEIDLSNVTKIGAMAFLGCPALASVSVPSSVVKIEGSVFADCENLAEVQLGKGIQRIGENAFRRCSALVRINIPSSVTGIEGWAFNNCSSLVQVELSEGLQHIGFRAFAGCSSLASISIPSTTKNIGDNTFSDCRQLRDVELQEGLQTIGNAAFFGCYSLESITIPSSVATIGNHAFGECRNLTELTLREGVLCIDPDAFTACTALEHINIPPVAFVIEIERSTCQLLRGAMPVPQERKLVASKWMQYRSPSQIEQAEAKVNEILGRRHQPEGQKIALIREWFAYCHVTKFGPNHLTWLFRRGLHTLAHDGNSHAMHWDGTRESSLVNGTIENILRSQKGGKNEILDVLGGADAFRDVAADLVSQMINEGSGLTFRLRGDTVGYLAEFLLGNMSQKLADAVLFAIHSHSVIVQGKDMKAALCGMDVRRLWETKQQPFPGTSPENQIQQCNVGTDEHGSFGPHRSSCGLLSLSGKVWRWPGDACRSVLPPEAGRRIIRRIALRAGIPKMTNEAFLLAEEAFLHTLGVLLVDAIESSIEMGESASYLDDDDSLVYGAPKIGSPDMFEIPPPPLCVPAGEKAESAAVGTEFIYTIVPGLVRASAERRNILPRHVYGDTWVPSYGFTSEEEKMIEESYYYDSPYEGSSDDEYDDIIEEVQIEESPIIGSEFPLDEVDEERESEGKACDESSDGAYTEGSESHGSEMDFDFTAEDVDWEELEYIRARDGSVLRIR